MTQKLKPLVGTIKVPSDKSITHRAILLGALAKGRSKITALTFGRDNLGSIRVMQQLGVKISTNLPKILFNLAKEEQLQDIFQSETEESLIEIDGRGAELLSQPKAELYCGNSGTTARLLTGILAGCSFSATLSGDKSLSSRPFKRVTEPLSQMGAKFSSDHLPLTVQGGKLKGLIYESPRASAQVKSAILLAGLVSKQLVTVIEPERTRDHTERMLTNMGLKIEEKRLGDKKWQVKLPPLESDALPRPFEKIKIPGDFSAAAFFMVLGSIVPNSRVKIKDVGFNETRIGLYSLLCEMGANILVSAERIEGGEKVVDLDVSAASLYGIIVTKEDVVLAIDEIPALAVAAAFAQGTTTIRGAEELRVKESDRLAMIADLLISFGISVTELPDGLMIQGVGSSGLNANVGPSLSKWRTSGDHRIAMCGAILEYCRSGKITLEDTAAVQTSFPDFLETFRSLCR